MLHALILTESRVWNFIDFVKKISGLFVSIQLRGTIAAPCHCEDSRLGPGDEAISAFFH